MHHEKQTLKTNVNLWKEKLALQNVFCYCISPHDHHRFCSLKKWDTIINEVFYIVPIFLKKKKCDNYAVAGIKQ